MQGVIHTRMSIQWVGLICLMVEVAELKVDVAVDLAGVCGAVSGGKSGQRGRAPVRGSCREAAPNSAVTGTP